MPRSGYHGVDRVPQAQVLVANIFTQILKKVLNFLVAMLGYHPEQNLGGLRTTVNTFLGSVRNKASPSDNDWLKLLWTDWFENLSDKFTLK